MIRIAILEDNPSCSLTLKMMLETGGYEVVGAFFNIHDFLDKIDEKYFDVLLADVRLGFDNGIDFVLNLDRRIHSLKKVVFMTGTRGEELKRYQKAIKRIDNAFLILKPFDYQTLVEALSLEENSNDK
jgi:DNA-binding NtrC family response regulator